MRNISATALNRLTTMKGVEPVLIVSIQWKAGATAILYSDRKIPNTNIIGKIVSFGNLDNITKISGSGQSQSISIVLSDDDGELKRIINFNDIHKRLVNVYQWFMDISISDKFLLFKGQISSPIIWKEGERTLSFDVVSRLEDNEVGFSAEEGQFPMVPHNLIGKAWPLGFGTNVRVPTLQLNVAVVGTSVDQIAFPDPDLLNKIADNERSAGTQYQAAQYNGFNAVKATRFKSQIKAEIHTVEAAIEALQNNPDADVSALVSQLGTFGFDTSPGDNPGRISPYIPDMPPNTLGG